MDEETQNLTMQRKRPQALVWVAATIGAILMLTSVVFLLAGGKINVIETPSMATYAPVGSLVLTLPADYDTLQAGDTILFNVAGGETAYFHRIVSVDAGGLSTQGDLNGTIDPWLVTPADMLGKEIFHAAALGYLVKMLPALVIGSILTWMLTYFYLPFYWKAPAYIFGVTLIASAVNFLYHPFVNVSVLSQTLQEGVATTTFVPTGLWALDGSAYGGSTVSNVQPGEIGTITSSVPDPTSDQFSVDLTPHMEPWVWTVLSFLWALPLVMSLGYFILARVKGWDMLPEETAEAIAEEAGDGQDETGQSGQVEQVPAEESEKVLPTS